MTPSFYYVSNIFLSCNINIPSFIGNPWWDLLLGNHLKLTSARIESSVRQKLDAKVVKTELKNSF